MASNAALTAELHAARERIEELESIVNREPLDPVGVVARMFEELDAIDEEIDDRRADAAARKATVRYVALENLRARVEAVDVLEGYEWVEWWPGQFMLDAEGCPSLAYESFGVGWRVYRSEPVYSSETLGSGPETGEAGKRCAEAALRAHLEANQ